jgi:hypothetical protein
MTNDQPTDLPRFATLTSLPSGYTLTRRLAIESQKTFFRLNFASLIPLTIGMIFFFGVDRLLATLNIPAVVSVAWDESSRVPYTLTAIVMTVLLLSFHELCHGLAFQAFGAKTRYGINLRKAVAFASAVNSYLTRDAYLVVALAPLAVITLGAIVGMVLTDGVLRFLFALMGTMNAGAAVGDLWFTIECLRQPSTLLVRDFGEGAELYTSQVA